MLATKAKMAEYSTSNESRYVELCTDLIVQAMIALNENEYLVRCRAVDMKVAKKAAPAALAKYKSIMLTEAGEHVTATVTVNEEERQMLPPPPSAGVSVSW